MNQTLIVIIIVFAILILGASLWMYLASKAKRKIKQKKYLDKVFRNWKAGHSNNKRPYKKNLFAK